MQKKKPYDLLITLLLFAVLLLAVVWLSDAYVAQIGSEGTQMMENNIRRSAVQCYALEGSYPETLEYLENHYGLWLDRKRYVYHYRNLGANMLPQISVFVLES